MDKWLKTLVVALFIGIICSDHASAQFTLSAEIRPRAEYRHGFKKPLESALDPAFFIEQRTRINAKFESEKFDVFVSLQDVRTWGAVSQIYKTDPSLSNMYEAWAAYKINSNHSIAVGRMALDYDNARFLGNLGWAQQGRSHDLVKYVYKGESSALHLGAAFNQDANTPEYGKLASTYYSGVANYKTMQYAWYHKDWEKSKLSLLLLNNGLQAADSSVNFSQTLGLYGTKKLGGVGLEYELYYQTGKDGGARDISAYMATLNATFFATKPASLTVGFDYLSGDKSDTEKVEAFNPMYGTNHKFYGFMDYFYVGNGHGNKGLVDVYLKTKIKTGSKSALLANLHQFMSGSKVGVNESGSDYSSALGTELDLVYNLNVAPDVNFKLGYSQMFYTESMEAIKGSADPSKNASWAWAMFTFKPTLFTTKSN